MNNRKRQVILASQKLFVEKGFQNTSIQDILDEVHISKGTFYNYFASKNECLIAILEKSRKELDIKKHELLIGQDPSDKNVLIRQISILLQVNREENLVPIFESVFHSKEPELKQVITQFHMAEMDWLAKRLIDIYGKTIIPYRFDCTIVIFGIIQQLLRVWVNTRQDPINPVLVVSYAMRQLDSILPAMIAEKDTFLGQDLACYINKNMREKTVNQKDLLEQLTGFQKGIAESHLEAGIQYTTTLLAELPKEKPQLFVMEAIIMPFSNSFNGTTHAAEAHEIANYLWLFVSQQKKKNNVVEQ